MRSRRSALLLAVLAWVLACGGRESRPSVLLISIDTLRADHLGAYGYPRATSPRLDAFAREAIVFERALAPAPWTLPSHAALLTGRHPREIGFRDDDAVLPAGVETLAESFARAGYRSAAFVDSSESGYVGAARGFARGFDHYHHAPFAAGGELRYDIAATVDRALAWLDRRRGARPFFLFLHTKSVHAVPAKAPCAHPSCPPYDQPPPWRFSLLPGGAPSHTWIDPLLGQGQDYLWGLNREIFHRRLGGTAVARPQLEELVALYDAGIRYTDTELGRLLDALRTRGLDGTTVVAVTADHGEAFLEHDYVVHQQLYQPLLHVPLLLRLPPRPDAPRRAAARLVAPAPLAALAPTLLRLAGIEPPPRMVPPLPLPAEATPPPLEPPGEAAFFASYEVPSKFEYHAASVRRGRFKLIRHNPRGEVVPRLELYDLERDPGERRPVADRPDVVEELLALLRSWLSRPPESAATLRPRGPEEDSLRALPYLD